MPLTDIIRKIFRRSKPSMSRYVIQTPAGDYPASHYLITDYGVEFFYEGVLSVYLSGHQVLIHDFNSGVTGNDFDQMIERVNRHREEFKRSIAEKKEKQLHDLLQAMQNTEREKDVV